MLKIRECKNGNEIYYQFTVCENSAEYIVSKIQYRSVMREINGRYWLILYAPNMVPICEVFEFLNYTSAHQSINTRVKSMQALKLLYSFGEIIGKKFEEFLIKDMNNLKLFLKGISPSSAEISVELITPRSNRTVNGYLAVLRSYLLSIGVKNEALMRISHNGARGDSCSIDYNWRYQSSEGIPVQSIEVPSYISVEEFAVILKIIREKYSLKDECIVRLMYQHGLRLGEVLGLTNDDLVEENFEQRWVPVAYIRNRVSDKPYQKAKTCMNVIDKKQYYTKDYQEYGFQKVIIDEDLYQLLNRYICDEHGRVADKWPDIYEEKSLADRIRKDEPFEEKNRYVFISCYGRPLRADSWNRRLREIFKEAGIGIDTQVRKHNLSHRFRHGFAMYQVKYLGRNEMELKHLMRHSSIKSVAAYFKPSMKDQLELKQEFEESLMLSIPSLKYGQEK